MALAEQSTVNALLDVGTRLRSYVVEPVKATGPLIFRFPTNTTFQKRVLIQYLVN